MLTKDHFNAFLIQISPSKAKVYGVHNLSIAYQYYSSDDGSSSSSSIDGGRSSG